MSVSKPHLLSPTLWKKHYSLYPVVAICGAGCVLAGAYIAYMLKCKTDISLRTQSWKENARYKFVKPDENTKLVAVGRIPPVDPELIKLRKEVGSYRA